MRTPALLLVAATVGSACEGENLFEGRGGGVINGDPEPDAVFEAVQMEYENEDGDRVDLIDEGAEWVLVFDEPEGRFESSFQHLDIDHDIEGTFVITGDTLTFSDDPFVEDDRTTERAFEFTRFGDETLFFRDVTTTWDIDSDGFEEAADLDIRLDRRE